MTGKLAIQLFCKLLVLLAFASTPEAFADDCITCGPIVLNELGYAKYATLLDKVAPSPLTNVFLRFTPLNAMAPVRGHAQGLDSESFRGTMIHKTHSEQSASGLYSDYLIGYYGTGSDKPVISAVGRKIGVGEVNASGELRITKSADLYARIEKLPNGMWTAGHIADIQIVRIPATPQYQILGISRTGVQAQIQGNSFQGSIQPAGGVAIERALPGGQSLRFGVGGGPDILFYPSLAPSKPAVGPYLYTGAEVVF
jgi:hypothetical protein